MVTTAEPTLKRVAFVGLPSPWSDPVVKQRNAMRQLSRAARENLRKQESKRQMRGFCRFQGVTVRTVGPEDGFSRTYTWGPDVFVQDMTLEDIDRLHNGHASLEDRLAYRQAFQVLDDIIVI